VRRVGLGTAVKALLLGCVGNALLVGCAGNAVVRDELPDAPIALLYRTPEQARERADVLADRKGKPDPVVAGAGVMKLNDVDDYLDRVRGQRRRAPQRHDGRAALLRPRTGEIEPLDAFLPGALPLDWSPSRDRILFVSRHQGEAQLYEYRIGPGVVTRLLGGREPRIDGAYGPDDRVAYVEARRAAGEVHLSVWTTEPRARPIERTDGPGDVGVEWSRDGRFLLFERADERGRRFIVSLDLAEDGEPRVIARGADPAISPGGDWVVYARELSEGWRLWRMRPDGTGKSALGARSQGQAEERAPTISPDGRYVAYVAEEENRQHLRVRRMDGTGDRLLLEDGDGALPAW